MKKLVKIYYHENGQLSVVTPDKVERFISVFYNALYLRTQKEIDDEMEKYKQQEKELADKWGKEDKSKPKKKWYQFWK